MRRTLQRDFPQIPVHKNTAAYFGAKAFSKTQTKNFNWDVIRNDPQLDLIDSLKGLRNAEVGLEAKRQFRLKKRKDLDSQWKNLEEKEENFKKEFIKFNTFVRENFEKRQRAAELIKETTRIIEERTSKLIGLRNKYEDMTAIKEALDLKIKEHKIYEQFLEKVVSCAPEFKNTIELINRYECLQKAKKELANRQETNLTELESARSNMLKLVEDNQLKILGLSTELSTFNSRYQRAVSNSIHWEGVVQDIRNGCYDYASQFIDVKKAIWYVYLTMCHRENTRPKLDRDDFEGHLVFIKHNLGLLKKMNKFCQKKNDNDETS